MNTTETDSGGFTSCLDSANLVCPRFDDFTLD